MDTQAHKARRLTLTAVLSALLVTLVATAVAAQTAPTVPFFPAAPEGCRVWEAHVLYVIENHKREGTSETALGEAFDRAYHYSCGLFRVLTRSVTMIRRSWMMGGSVEATLELWASTLRDVKGRMRPLFQQDRMAASAGLFLDALLGPERRKTGWMRAEAAGDPGPWRQQALLGRAQWDANTLRDMVRDYVVETLAAPDAVLVVDETGFLKQGRASCGGARQYTGSAGKITNCQIGVFMAYVSSKGHAFIDRALYLPKAWSDDRARRTAAHVPEDIT